MVSELDAAKRSLVSLLKRLATLYYVTLRLTRDSPDTDIRKAYRTVSLKTHPDHEGNVGGGGRWGMRWATAADRHSRIARAARADGQRR